ncbi:MAG: FG-GAP repeat domain-containing protein [Ignavibacteriales bacterium]
MKYAAIKKLYREEIIGFRHANLVIFSLLFTSLTASRLPAQIPINGFCRYKSFNTEESFKKLSALNFNNDSYTDIALFDSDKKEIITCSGQTDGGFLSAKINRTGRDISQLQQIDRKSASSRYFAFISRKTRRAGLLNLTESGNLRFLSEIKLDSYPANMSLADVNGDGREEVLLSGGSFRGLSILANSNLHMKERKIFPGSVFTFAIFTDLNNDGYPDIAAYDQFSSSLKFLYNDSRGEFREVRELKSAERITSLQSYDYNLDGYQDLIMVRGGSLLVILGDNIASFSRTFTLKPVYNPDIVAVGDFNNDGFNDIAYLDKKRSILSVIFAKNDGKFYPEIIYLYKENLTDIIPYYSKFVSGILALGSNGKFYLVSNLKAVKDGTSISLGAEPASISYFDAGNNKITDLCYIDRFRPALNLILRNNGGIPSTFYSVDLVDTCSNIEIDNREEFRKTFYCYCRGKRLVQIISVDFKTNVIRKESIYSSGPIMDLQISRDLDELPAKIYMVLKKSGNLAVEVQEYNNFRYTRAVSGNLESNITEARIDLNDPLSVFYWKKEKKSFYFKRLLLNKELKPQNYIVQYVANSGEINNVAWLVGDVFNRDKNNAVLFFSKKEAPFAVISTGKENIRFTIAGNSSTPGDLNFSSIYLGEVRFNGLNKLMVFNGKDMSLNKFDILYKQKILLRTRLASAPDLESYFIKNMNFKNYHLVYTDKAERCIRIKELAL